MYTDIFCMLQRVVSYCGIQCRPTNLAVCGVNKAMKKAITILITVIVIMALTACSASKDKEKSIFDRIQESSVALMESPDGVKVYVWNMQDLASLSSLQIEEAPRL